MAEKAENPAGDFDKIGRPVQGALDFNGYKTLEDVSKTTAKALLKLHGIGPKGIRQLREAMAERGLKFADE